MSERMAFMADMDNPYITLDNDYIETVWWLLDGMFKKVLFMKELKFYHIVQDVERDLLLMKLLKAIR